MNRSARGAAARRRGRRAETAAAWLLRLKGFRILARDLRYRLGEIDLVARRGSLLVFVEVKARADFEVAAEALKPRQRQRIARAARAYLGPRPELQGLAQRFDAVLVGGRGWPRHVPDAWRESP
ncbi:MAG: YraN family protein [Alphaproteobacteria bacterium]|nr:YraN family protein [Alphaproteobacteria bacterium]